MFGVYLNQSEVPMAIFVREDWAIKWQGVMQRKAKVGTLFVREVGGHIQGDVIFLVDEVERVLSALRQDGLPRGEYETLAMAIEKLKSTMGL